MVFYIHIQERGSLSHPTLLQGQRPYSKKTMMPVFQQVKLTWRVKSASPATQGQSCTAEQCALTPQDNSQLPEHYSYFFLYVFPSPCILPIPSTVSTLPPSWVLFLGYYLGCLSSIFCGFFLKKGRNFPQVSFPQIGETMFSTFIELFQITYSEICKHAFNPTPQAGEKGGKRIHSDINGSKKAVILCLEHTEPAINFLLL